MKSREEKEQRKTEGKGKNRNGKDHTVYEEKHSGETTYIKDEKTGLYICVNPSGSMAYNYLYGRDKDDSDTDDSDDEGGQE